MTIVKIVALLLVALALTLVLNLAVMVIAWTYFLFSTGSVTMASDRLADVLGNLWFMLGIMATQELTWVVVPIAFLLFVDRRKFSWADLGLGSVRQAPKLFAAGVLLNVLLGLAILATTWLWGIQHVEVYGISAYGLASVAIYLAGTLVMVLMVGIGEETLFRGYIQTDLMRKYGNAAALVVTSLIFASVHIFFLISGQEVSPLSIVSEFMAALVMGYMYICTGSIWASIGFHFCQDFLAAGVFLTGSLPYGNYPLYLFSNATDISVAGISLGGRDNLPTILWMAVLLVALYAYTRVMKSEKSRKIIERQGPGS